MAPRATWKGFLKIAEVTCPVALYAAATSSERIALHIVNRATGHRVHRQYVDEATGAPVAPEDQVKGYEAAKDEFITLEPEDVAADGSAERQDARRFRIRRLQGGRRSLFRPSVLPRACGPQRSGDLRLDSRRPEGVARRRRSRARSCSGGCARFSSVLI